MTLQMSLWHYHLILILFVLVDTNLVFCWSFILWKMWSLKKRYVKTCSCYFCVTLLLYRTLSCAALVTIRFIKNILKPFGWRSIIIGIATKHWITFWIMNLTRNQQNIPVETPPNMTLQHTKIPNFEPMSGLLKKLLPLAAFFMAFTTVMAVLIVYMDNTGKN